MAKALSSGLESQLKQVIQAKKRCNGCRQRRFVQELARREPAALKVFRNNSGEAVPPYAVMEVTDAEIVDGRNILVIRKPTGDATKPHIINGARTIAIGDRGIWNWGTVKVAVTGTPVAGDDWGVTSGSWLLSSTGDAIMKMLGLLTTGYAMGQPFQGCRCTDGTYITTDAISGSSAMISGVDNLGTFNWSIDKSTIASGDTFTIVTEVVMANPLPASGLQVNSQATQDTIGLGPATFFPVGSLTVDSTTASIPASTSQKIDERNTFVTAGPGLTFTETYVFTYDLGAEVYPCEGNTFSLKLQGTITGGSYFATVIATIDYAGC